MDEQSEPGSRLAAFRSRRAPPLRTRQLDRSRSELRPRTRVVVGRAFFASARIGVASLRRLISLSVSFAQQ
jgi:hypothetical protein